MRRHSTFLLNRLLPFIAPLLVLVVAAEVRLQRFPGLFTNYRDRFERGLAEYEAVLSGTSRSWALPKEPFALNLGNLALHSQSMVVGCQLVRKYLDRMPKLQHVLFEVSYFSLDFLHEDTFAASSNAFYANAFNIRGDGGLRQLMDIRNYSAFMLHGNISTLPFLLGLVPAPEPAAEVPALAPVEVGDDRLVDAAAAKRAAFHGAMTRPGNRRVTLTTLESLLGELGARGIRVTFFHPPVTTLYAAHLDPKRLADIYAMFRGIAKRHSAPFLDYMADSRFTLDDFKDTDHLNASGAIKFARILSQDAMGRVSEKLPRITEKVPAGRVPTSENKGPR